METDTNYITLDIPSVTENQLTSKSLKRRWKQLPRLLRVVSGLCALLLLLFLIFLLSRSQHSHSQKLETPLGQLDNAEVPLITEHVLKPNLVEEVIQHPEENFEETDMEKQEDIAKFNNDQIPPPSRNTPRQDAVVNAMRHAWKSYRSYAWGHDHLLPISKSSNNWMYLGLTLIDGLDTLWMMDLKEEFDDARTWVKNQLNFNVNREVNLFETTIRVLGGLLSSYHLTQDTVFLNKSIDLADRLLGAFTSASGIPYSDVNLATSKASKPKWGPDSSTSEVSTIQIEFRDLSRITGNPIYAEKVNFVSNHIHKQPKFDGLVPIFINAQTGSFRQRSTITLGARGDSYYEYLLKQWIQMGQKETNLRDDYTEAISGMEFHLAKKTHPNKYLFFGELHGNHNNFVNKMDELTCFLPGTLALGVHFGMPPHHLTIAKDLMETCAKTWLHHPTHLAPEITFFNTENTDSDDFYVKNNDAHYLLRPETIESLWYMYRFTGNKTYQDWGWDMFQGIEKHCKVDGGYTTIGNVKNPLMTKPKDMMESFFLGETLKYLFLLFSDDQKLYSLDKWVFNTEGHPLPIYKD